MTTKNFLTTCFVVSLVIGFLMMSENQTEQKATLAMVLCYLIAALFFVWWANQCYDFKKKKVKQVSVSNKAIIGIFLFFISVNGGLVGTISIAVLLLLILIQIFSFAAWFVNWYKFKKDSK